MLGAALSVCVVPPSLRAEEIPFQFSRAFGLVLIRADVNGHRAVLILDTGSNHTAINSRFVDVASPGLRDTVSTEKGSPHPARGVFTNVSLMKIGPFVWRDHRILAMDMQDPFRHSGGERRRLARHGLSERIRNGTAGSQTSQVDVHVIRESGSTGFLEHQPIHNELKVALTCLDFLIHVELRISAFRQTHWACDSPGCCAVARCCTPDAS